MLASLMLSRSSGAAEVSVFQSAITLVDDDRRPTVVIIADFDLPRQIEFADQIRANLNKIQGDRLESLEEIAWLSGKAS